jgi:hypothetical protein
MWLFAKPDLPDAGDTKTAIAKDQASSMATRIPELPISTRNEGANAARFRLLLDGYDDLPYVESCKSAPFGPAPAQLPQE